MVKYYVGVRPNDCVIFRSSERPTQNCHPLHVTFCFGPYRRRKDAERAAMWQNYRITIPTHYSHDVPLWDGKPDSHLTGTPFDGDTVISA